eukprot:Gb_37162 [translate_table: standard]
MGTPKEHIEEIRVRKFSIGGEDNPLTEDLHHAVKHLSAELYTKDVHFLMELIQNAEDNTYPPNVEPSLEFLITTRDVAGVGAPATLLIFNNERGFNKSNVESLCSVGRSTKKGKRQGGYIGEKGIGFKSVFLVTEQPHIFSNGYQIRFNEFPTPGVKIGYIVPEWIDDKPSIEDIREVYGCHTQLPTTTIVLPLRPEKVESVKHQLAHIHPEVILFMSKIKKLSVRDEDEDSPLNRVNEVSVSRETEFRTNKSADCESFMLHLSAQENKSLIRECSYYMWRQRFPVNLECRVEERKDITRWAITLAFPMEERLTRGMTAADIYAFLPTEMVTGLPFIIQADFLLASSRESIILDNKWNQGILDCLPSAFCAAFLSLLHSVESVPPPSRLYIFKYLPMGNPSYPQLRQVRDAIRERLRTEEVVMCEIQNAFCIPTQARRILPAFRDIMEKATEEGLGSPDALWSTGVFILHSCMDKPEFSHVLQFLGVDYVSNDWYFSCIQTPGWLAAFSEDLYVELLCFLAENWDNRLSSYLHTVPLFKYAHNAYNVGWASLSDISNGTKIYFASEVKDISWLTKWTGEFGSVAQYKFMPDATQRAMRRMDEWHTLQRWLNRYPEITDLSVSSFSKQLLEEVMHSKSTNFVIRVTQFLHYSLANDYISPGDVHSLCSKLPVVDNCDNIHKSAKVILVPECISKWFKLLGDNPWSYLGFVVLSERYLRPPPCAGGLGGGNGLGSFITERLRAVDIPNLTPPDAPLPGLSSSFSKEKALMLLEWIFYVIVIRHDNLPQRFRSSIAEGKWLKTHCGYKSPSTSFLFHSRWESAFQLKDLPFIDVRFYGRDIDRFKDALENIGVVIEFGQGCDLVAKYIKMHSESNAIIRFYKYLHQFKWKPGDSNPVEIWIPDDGGVEGVWKDAKLCVVHDDNGLFQSRLEILENYFENDLLPFFSTCLGVSLHPRLEDYCNLWMDWVSSNHQVTKDECCSVWRKIVKHWKNSSARIERHIKRPGLRLPAFTNRGDIQLSTPNETFIPDDLQLRELFKRASIRPKFAWHPDPSDPEIPLDLLFSIFNRLGVRNISESVEKLEVSVPNDLSLRKLRAGVGMFGVGLYKIALAYLAQPSFRLSAERRHQIVSTLVESSLFEATQPFTVEYSLLLPSEDGPETIKVTTTKAVRWEKDRKRVLTQKFDQSNKKLRMLFATNFAKVISDGLLPEHPDLVAGLCDMLNYGCLLGFDLEASDVLLQTHNLQLFIEDQQFLLLHFPEANENFRTPSRQWNERQSNSSGGRQIYDTPTPRPAESCEQFSPDILQGWEKMLHVFKQAFGESSASSNSEETAFTVAKSVFPATSIMSDADQSESEIKTSDVQLVMAVGDAYLKLLIVLKVLGGGQMILPLKMENLVRMICEGRGHEEVLKLEKHIGRGTGQIEEGANVGMLKLIAGAAVMKLYGAESGPE